MFFLAWKRKCHERVTAAKELASSAVQQERSDPTSLEQLHTSEQELFQLKGAMQRYSLANAILKYGSAAPYLVSLTITLPDSPSEEHRLWIEFRRLDDMPHTIYTFFTLVDLGFYTGTRIGLSDDGAAIEGGNPRDGSISKRTRSSLARLYAERGYGATPFVIDEQSPTAPCVRGGFGIFAKGPQFAIQLGNARSKDETWSCPGKVVKGVELLSRLQSLAQDMRATIVAGEVIGGRGRTSSLAEEL